VRLNLRLRGETVVGVEPPAAGYCRRGIAALVEHKSVAAALPIIEHSCSYAGTAHRVALCRALEAAADAHISQHARLTRILFAEIERSLARLWVLGWVAYSMGLVQLWRDALQRREDLFAALEEATGRRQFWGIALPGGVRDDLVFEPLGGALAKVEHAVTAWRVALGPRGLLGRAGAGAGLISAERAQALGLEGVAGCGSVARDDLRRSDSSYDDLGVEWPPLDAKRSGDVTGRVSCAVEDLAASVAIAQQCLHELPSTTTEHANALTLPSGEHQLRAAVEGPHGPALLEATLSAASTLTGLRLETPGAATLAALPEVLEGRPLVQVPAILASLDLCLECLDH
jgi:ech hydrogenase subunit E